MFSRLDVKEGVLEDAPPPGLNGIIAGYSPTTKTVAGYANYCNSLVTSCCTLLACARAEMPVWLRISYLDMAVEADA